MPTRRAVLGTLGGLTAAGAAGGAYAFWVEPALRLAVAEHRILPPGWPAGRALTIAALADLHAAEPFMSLARVEAVVRATNALAPDVVVLLGDYRGSGRLIRQPVPIAETAQVLRGLRAPRGVHAVLGNHDWWDDAEVQRLRGGLPESFRILAEAGIGVLHNDAVKLGDVWLAGLGSLWAFPAGRGFVGTDDLGGALGAVTDAEPVILLCHEPDIFPRVPAGRVALTLSGHTHGGQVRILGHSPVVPSRYGNRYAYGHVVEDGKHLVVSGGIGTSILPVRFGVPPEITLIRVGTA
jgi:predicted MPP superfamily phosphohydrolase